MSISIFSINKEFQVLIVRDIKSKMRSGVKVYVVVAYVPSGNASPHLDQDMSGVKQNFKHHMSSHVCWTEMMFFELLKGWLITWVQKCKTVLKRCPEVTNMANSGNMFRQIRHVRVFFRKCHFLSPGGPHVKSKNNWALKCIFCQFTAKIMRGWKITVSLTFLSGQNNFHRYPGEAGKIRAFYCGPDSRRACGQGNRVVCSCSHVASVLLTCCVKEQDPVIFI